jgi:molybdopterin-guanine dinucleotide biosynthesis protein
MDLRAGLKVSPVDLVLVEGFKRDAFPKRKYIAPPTASRYSS